MTPVRYVSPDEDSARWAAVPPRDGDVVVSTRSKHGTTWVQALCLSLVHGPDLPAPLAELSPWVDWTVEPTDALARRLAAQPHRRVLKTHTPLDGLPLHPGTTYVVVARDPLDAAVSLHHQGANLDRERLAELTGAPVRPPVPSRPRPDLEAWLRRWVERDTDPRTDLDGLPGVLHHLADAWARRSSSQVVLVHYDDLLHDLPGEARRLATRLGVRVPETAWGPLLAGLGLETMRARADRLAPAPPGVFRDPAAFFRSGRSGTGREVLGPEGVRRYRERAAGLAPADLLAWLHRDDGLGAPPRGPGA
ncbi:sulfotransferase domain-containing protein [Vallicoccus soli]|uniref:Sulfotransferase domain-containing protein n=1 Tax=Vallicoccus soli TaxID=2339232 RepID=A0A3A3ZHK0_9ACTN|nr:sulfotransferase domain-containing protein [Vallicoccus soli]RJK94810.1 sulfotransferase domain-containing protein [Vallicoccus soli]